MSRMNQSPWPLWRATGHSNHCDQLPISTDTLSRGLGWFSIGLGLAELLAPGQMKRLTGIRSSSLLQFYGLREIGAGIGILGSQRQSPWMWGRVAGDIVDLATLRIAYVEGNDDDRTAAIVATAAVAGVTVLDIVSAIRLTAIEKGNCC